jgi:urease gamma subunit
MIVIKAEVKEEPDVQPFTRVFEYLDESDKETFFGSIKTRLNTNESLALYWVYVVDQLRAHKPTDTMEKNAPIIFSEDVMIGVPETLRTISFKAILGNSPGKQITIHEPIPTSYTTAVDGAKH